LKLPTVSLPTRARTRLPRSSERGSIEASEAPGVRSRGRVPFRALRSVALLKRPFAGFVDAVRRNLPRSSERGSIEAPAPTAAHASATPFRALRSVALLKQGAWFSRLGADPDPFRALRSVALLKLTSRTERGLPPMPFRALRSVALLKRLWRTPQGHGGPGLPRSSERGSIKAVTIFRELP